MTSATATPTLDVRRAWALSNPGWRALVMFGLGLGCFVLRPSSAVALALGVGVAQLGLNPFEARTRSLGKRLLVASVVGLGAGLDLGAVADVGVVGAVLASLSVAVCLALGLLGARLLRVDPITGLLVACGTAICGGSAIAAVAPTVRAREHQLTAALGTVFALNAVALVVFPPIGAALGLDAQSFGLWCAIAIHDTSSVVGAAAAHSPEALDIATLVKLSRALWIVPLTAVFALHTRRAQAGGAASDAPRAARPWFILAFVVLAAMSTFLPGFSSVGASISALSRRLLVVTLFLVGATLTPAALRRIGLRPLLQGATLWALISALSLGAITTVLNWG